MCIRFPSSTPRPRQVLVADTLRQPDSLDAADRSALSARVSQSYPLSPAAKANADGSTTIYFGPNQPDGVENGNWIQTVQGKGWNTILRLYSPLEPFFTKQWRPTEIELVK